MQNKWAVLIGFLMIFLTVFSCAKRGSITGGPKDETPPKFVRASPPNLSTSFKADEIRIYFDELVTIEDAQKIIISPPMEIKPEITPAGYPAKFVRVKFKEALLPNTTYNINFGSSIVDNNEKNKLPFFQYVFSTGKMLDSLFFKGIVKDAFKQETAENISVFLYEINENYKDSIIFTDVPRYISNTLDSTTFEFKNLKAGKYKLIALQDKASNYTFEPKLDKIAFFKDTITIPQDSIAELLLFKEAPDFKYIRAKQLSKNQFSIGYEGVLVAPELAVMGINNDSLRTTFFKDREKDTLNFWVKPFIAQDSLLILAKSKTTIDTITARYKDQYKDSLKVSAITNTLKLTEDLVLSANTPIDSLFVNRANLIDQDTVKVNFTYKLDRFKNELQLSFAKKEASSYALELLPGAISDFLENTNDTLNFRLNTLEEAEYGILMLTFSKFNGEKGIVQLLQGENIKAETTITQENAKLTFNGLNPGDYTVRIIYDTNGNGVWDTGNFLKNLQPEKVYYYPNPINVRANWDVQQEISFTTKVKDIPDTTTSPEPKAASESEAVPEDGDE